MSSRQRQFEQLVRDHADDLHRYALWLCRNPTLAKDLTQETWMRAWRALDKLRDMKVARSWLITILRREFARTFERKVPELTRIEDLELADPGARHPDDRTEVRLLRQAMLALDSKYSEPLVLQVLGGFSCEEIADILGITRSAVMTQVFRARQQLKQALADDASQAAPNPEI